MKLNEYLGHSCPKIANKKFCIPVLNKGVFKLLSKF